MHTIQTKQEWWMWKVIPSLQLPEELEQANRARRKGGRATRATSELQRCGEVRKNKAARDAKRAIERRRREMQQHVGPVPVPGAGEEQHRHDAGGQREQ